MSEAYVLERDGAVLLFKTRSYKAEQGSVLHSGIFNREMVSTLAAGAVLVAAVMAALSMGMRPGMAYAAPAVALFATVFFVFRFFVLSEQELELKMDKDAGIITISTGPMLRKRTLSMPMSDVTGIAYETVVVDPVNRDGIKVVEKISLQHGMHIPGFGERKEFYTVGLNLKGAETVTVFASTDSGEAGRLTEALTKYTGVGVAQKD